MAPVLCEWRQLGAVLDGEAHLVGVRRRRRVSVRVRVGATVYGKARIRVGYAWSMARRTASVREATSPKSLAKPCCKYSHSMVGVCREVQVKVSSISMSMFHVHVHVTCTQCSAILGWISMAVWRAVRAIRTNSASRAAASRAMSCSATCHGKHR